MARFVLNPESSKPLYKQIVDYYENSIINGSLQLGNPLPAERDLAVQLGVNRSTVTTAYAELRANGLITSRQGSGTRVSLDAAELMPSHLTTWNKLRNQHLSEETPLKEKPYSKMNDSSFINLNTGMIAPELCLARNAYDLATYTTNSEQISPMPIQMKEAITQFIHYSASSESMVLSSSLEQAVLISMKCFLNPGDVIAIEEPINDSLLNLFLASGIQVIRYSTEQLRNLKFLKDGVKLIIASSLTIDGCSLTQSAAIQQRKKILTLCEKREIPIIEIVEYSLLKGSHEYLPHSFYELGMDRKLVMQIGHITGIAPSLSLGWILGPEHVMKRVAEVQIQLSMTPSPVFLEIIYNIFQSIEIHKHMEDVKEELHERKQQVRNKLNTLKDQITFLQVEDTTAIWFDFKPALHLEELIEALSEAHVLLSPSLYEEAVRIKLPLASVSKDNLLEATNRLISVLNTLHIKQFAEIY
ncbi:aminotransferase class I/II-fold pyridoxal phosphate-dependent enzyme [Bacillus sp. RAR_GA_16]|uniref:aminotransferase class I/II-fold pyridoxal phosphate-dependent enzyme n=1 Tax=Bacillus sp. RAR_GA_16 TaxID=2876774 RepID=UPI001CCD30D2|nr:aminotransferase class I/II-fold pyridoxal phosphate-dependent enzyme [Bacillus sp. RAR_GA_16]MCA0173324.1 GntR family transcriptional regulator [Bacillus sp. RAR_GA_16]